MSNVRNEIWKTLWQFTLSIFVRYNFIFSL